MISKPAFESAHRRGRGPARRMSIVECPACGYEPIEQISIVHGRCPKCQGFSWHRLPLPGGLLYERRPLPGDDRAAQPRRRVGYHRQTAPAVASHGCHLSSGFGGRN